MPVEKWQVYHVRTNYTDPPKNKYVIIMSLVPRILGLFINSTINQFTRKHPNLLPCEVLLPAAQHTFLRQDSYVHCQDAFTFWNHELNNLRGIIAQEFRAPILEAVRICPTLRREYQREILWPGQAMPRSR